MSLTKLQEQRGQLLSEARERLDQISENTDESRVKELEEQHDSAIAELDKLDARIKRESDQKAREERHEQEQRHAAEMRRPKGNDLEVRCKDEQQEMEYGEAFRQFLASGADLSAVDAEVRNLLRQGVADKEARTQIAGTDSAGGYTVPTLLRNELIEAMEATGPMFNSDITFALNTDSGAEIDVPAFDDTGDTSTAIHTEGTEPVDDNSGDIVLTERVLNAYIYKTPFLKWSYELAQDSIFNWESILGSVLGKRLGKIANSKLTVGTGTNEPNGVVTASLLGKTAASATAFTSDELIDLQDSLDEAYEGANTAWMMRKATRSLVRKLKDGDGNYLWQMGNIKEGTPEQLLGKALYLNEAMVAPATGTKPIIYGDFKEYYVRRVGTPVMGIMREKFWPQLGIAGLVRFDGEIRDPRAIKHLVMA